MDAQNVGTSSVVLPETRDFAVFVLSDSYFDRRSIHMGDSDVIYSYQLFPAILWGKLCEMFVILTSVDVAFSIR